MTQPWQSKMRRHPPLYYETAAPPQPPYKRRSAPGAQHRRASLTQSSRRSESADHQECSSCQDLASQQMILAPTNFGLGQRAWDFTWRITAPDISPTWPSATLSRTSIPLPPGQKSSPYFFLSAAQRRRHDGASTSSSQNTRPTRPAPRTHHAPIQPIATAPQTRATEHCFAFLATSSTRAPGSSPAACPKLPTQTGYASRTPRPPGKGPGPAARTSRASGPRPAPVS